MTNYSEKQFNKANLQALVNNSAITQSHKEYVKIVMQTAFVL